MPIQLIISDANLGEDQLDALTRDLCQTLCKETAIQAVIEQGEAGPGSKSKKITAEALALALLNSPGAVGLTDVLKAYVLCSTTLVIEVKNGDKSVIINFQNVQDGQMEHLLGKLIKSEAHG